MIFTAVRVVKLGTFVLVLRVNLVDFNFADQRPCANLRSEHVRAVNECSGHRHHPGDSGQWNGSTTFASPSEKSSSANICPTYGLIGMPAPVADESPVFAGMLRVAVPLATAISTSTVIFQRRTTGSLSSRSWPPRNVNVALYAAMLRDQ